MNPKTRTMIEHRIRTIDQALEMHAGVQNDSIDHERRRQVDIEELLEERYELANDLAGEDNAAGRASTVIDTPLKALGRHAKIKAITEGLPRASHRNPSMNALWVGDIFEAIENLGGVVLLPVGENDLAAAAAAYEPKEEVPA